MGLYLLGRTGILPIKKYGTHSALNMFEEISMVRSGKFTEYMGFTEGGIYRKNFNGWNGLFT